MSFLSTFKFLYNWDKVTTKNVRYITFEKIKLPLKDKSETEEDIIRSFIINKNYFERLKNK